MKWSQMKKCLLMQTLIMLIIFRVRAYGPGVEPTGPVVAAPANFIVETFSAGKGNVQVSVKDPRGQSIPVRLSLQANHLSNFEFHLCNNRSNDSMHLSLGEIWKIHLFPCGQSISVWLRFQIFPMMILMMIH